MKIWGRRSAEGKIFLKMAVCRAEFSGHRGIAPARPYHSSFPVTVRHLSVSLAQLAGLVSCGTKQHRRNPWMWGCVRVKGGLQSPSDGRRGEVSLRHCHVNMISEGVAHSVSIQKGGFFLIPTAVWDTRLHISSGIAQRLLKSNALWLLFTMLIYSWN